MVAFVILGQQYEVVSATVVFVGPVEACVFRYVGFAAEDGLKPFVLGLLVEKFNAEHVAVIGDGTRRHLVLLGFLDKPSNAGSTIENGILGVNVEVDKFLHQKWLVYCELSFYLCGNNQPLKLQLTRGVNSLWVGKVVNILSIEP